MSCSRQESDGMVIIHTENLFFTYFFNKVQCQTCQTNLKADFNLLTCKVYKAWFLLPYSQNLASSLNKFVTCVKMQQKKISHQLTNLPRYIANWFPCHLIYYFDCDIYVAVSDNKCFHRKYCCIQLSFYYGQRSKSCNKKTCFAWCCHHKFYHVPVFN